jgi:hypothetical protein
MVRFLGFKVGYDPLVGNGNKKWDCETSLLLDVKLKFELWKKIPEHKVKYIVLSFNLL